MFEEVQDGGVAVPALQADRGQDLHSAAASRHEPAKQGDVEKDRSDQPVEVDVRAPMSSGPR